MPDQPCLLCHKFWVLRPTKMFHLGEKFLPSFVSPSKISFKGVCVYRGFLEHKPRSAGKQQSRKAKRLCHMFLRCYVLEGDCCRKEVLVSVCCRGKHGCRMCFCFLLQSSSGCALYLFNFWNNHIPPPPFLWLGAKYVLF